MRFLMLIHDNPDRWEHPTFAQHDGIEQSELAAMRQQFDDLIAELVESGEYVSGYSLAAPALTRSVRVRGGNTTVSDGPHAAGTEQLAGYLVIDCESWERAEAIAARMPSTRFAPIEIRPVMVHSGSEM
jgi:hypothetical protein